jgi:nucleoside triphosphate pyrophosphatase
LSLWLAPAPLVIASKSAVRRAVLEAAGFPLEVRPADIDERGIEARSSAASPGEVAALLAREKARAIAAVMPGRFVLGADQTLALGQRRFSKPVDRAAAREQLQALRGRTHELHSAVAIVRDAEVLYNRVEVARLTMRPFADDFLDRYIDTAGSAVTASVGGYQLERTGIHLFSRIEGDHFTVLGLPLLPLLDFLRNQGLVA